MLCHAINSLHETGPTITTTRMSTITMTWADLQNPVSQLLTFAIF